MVTTIFYGLFVTLCIMLCRWLWRYYLLHKRLSIIPGPKCTPFIGLSWQIMNTPREDRFQLFNNLTQHFQNGITLTWIGVEPVVTINKPQYMEVVLPSNTLITKAKMYDMIKPWLGDGLVTSTGKNARIQYNVHSHLDNLNSGEIWFKHRRLITPAFHFNVLEEYAAAMRDKVEILTENIESQMSKNEKTPINIFELAVKYTLDTICETAMGIDIDSQRKPNSEYVKALHKFGQLSSDRYFRFWLRWDAIYHRTEKGQEYLKAIRTMHDFTEKVIIQKQLERKNQLNKNLDENKFDEFGKRKRKAFLDLLLDASESAENALSLREIREEVDTFMFAGHDTTSAAISWALFALGNAPEAQRKVHEELDDIFGNKTEVASTQQLRQLKYLDRVIKEALRLYPSAPSVSRSVENDTAIGDYLIPKGTILNIHIYQLHHNSDVWDDPEKFDPDRFLPDKIRSKHPYAYIPFSAGPRNCIGQKFALLELKTALTAILRKWHVSSVLKQSEIKMVLNFILRPHNGKVELYFTRKK